MNLKNGKDRKYLDKKNKMTEKQKELFNIIVLQGIIDNTEIGKIMYGKENTDDNDKRTSQNVRQHKRQMYRLFLGPNETVPGEVRNDFFIKYILVNEPNRLHNKFKKNLLSDSENEGISISSEPDLFTRFPLKARNNKREILMLVDYLDEKCWNDKNGLYKIKSPEKAGKTTEIEAFIKLCEERHVTKIVIISFKDNLNKNKTILEDAGSFMNWFMDRIYEQTGFKNEIERKRYRKIINEDPCGGSREYMEIILGKMNFYPDENFLLIVMDDIDELFDNNDIAEIFYYYLRTVFQNLRRVRQVITYSTDCYLKLNDLYSPFNVGETLTLCGLGLEDMKQVLKKYKTDLSEPDIETLLDWIGGSPYLWRATIYYLRGITKSEFEVEEFKKSAIANDDVQAFFYRISKTIEQDKQLLNSVRELLKFNFLNKLKTKTSYILEGLGVIKRDLDEQDKWLISCDIYKYFLEKNLPKKTDDNPNSTVSDSFNISILNFFNISGFFKNLKSIFRRF